MNKENLKQIILKSQNEPELSKYHLGNFLPESMVTRNIICFARDSNNNNVAIKFSDNPLLENEFNIIKSINHPNIIDAIAFIKSKEYFGLVMPLASGGDLCELASNSFLSQSHIREIMRSLFTALDYIHNLGIIHRDVKIENILIMSKSPNSEIVLSDFEFATREKYSTQIFGTPAFMAPEMLNKAMYDNKVDIWSAGVIMYLLCFYELPFDLQDPTYQLKFPDNEGFQVSKDEKDLISHLLCLNPDERYSAKDALNHKWFKINLEGEEVCMQSSIIYNSGIADSDHFNESEIQGS